MKPTLLMIRPSHSAKAFVADMGDRADRFTVLFDPIVRIEEAGNALPPAPPNRAFVFTSSNGVAAYARQHAGNGARAFCVNDTTAKAARLAGFSVLAGSGGAQDLVDLIDVPEVTYIRAADVAFDLCARLAAKGVTCLDHVAYRQKVGTLSQKSLDAIATRTVVLPVFSDIAAQSMIGQIQPSAGVTIVSISPAISDKFNAHGFDQIITARTPNRAGMIDALTVKIR